ncbi:hypothetical protein, conserved, partial [Eimeria tenella]
GLGFGGLRRGSAQVEKAKLCLDDPSHWVSGVQLLNSLDMEALCEGPPWQQPQLQQQSLQLLLLKAKLLHRLHAANEPQQHPGLTREELATEAESVLRTVLLLQPLYAPAWLCWGKLHDTLFLSALKQRHQQQQLLLQQQQQKMHKQQVLQQQQIHQDAPPNADGSANPPHASSSSSSGDSAAAETSAADWAALQLHLAAAVTGYVMDIQLRPVKSSLYMSRVLWLLSYDGDTRPPTQTAAAAATAAAAGAAPLDPAAAVAAAAAGVPVDGTADPTAAAAAAAASARMMPPGAPGDSPHSPEAAAAGSAAAPAAGSPAAAAATAARESSL